MAFGLGTSHQVCRLSVDDLFFSIFPLRPERPHVRPHTNGKLAHRPSKASKLLSTLSFIAFPVPNLPTNLSLPPISAFLPSRQVLKL